MSPDYPHHSDDAFMTNTTAVQSFVDPPKPVGPEELARPRYGRPERKRTDHAEAPPGADAAGAGGPAN